MAYKLAEFAGGKIFLTLALTGTAVTLLSMLLDNVTTVVIFGPLLILIARAQRVSPVPYLLAAALLTDTGGIATLVGDPPNIMIGSAADIDFNTFFFRMGPVVLVAWITILISLRLLFRKELSQPSERLTQGVEQIRDKRTWRIAVGVLAVMVALFSLHDALGWEVWFVAVLGMTILLLLSPRETIEHVMTRVETGLLMFFIGLFVVIGGVEHSGFLEHIGSFITPFVEADLLLATIVLMWVAAFLSAAIDNIPFTAAMIPIILGMEAAGLNVTPLWWGLSMGVGLGGNGTHIGSTANVFIVTISERLAREQNDPRFAITPGLWVRKGTPAMIASLAVSTVFFVLFFDHFARPIH
jgi:Na+/H+ antiporter NhaD/arsenite permease-like protein